MKIKEESIYPLFIEIDNFYKIDKLNDSEAIDIKQTLAAMIGEELDETIILKTIDNLRGFKTYIDKDIISTIINKFRHICGDCINYQNIKKNKK